MPHKEHLSPRALRAMTLGLEIAGLIHLKGVIYAREMWKTNKVRFRSLILHDITWYNMGLSHKMEPQTPMAYHNSLKQQVRGAPHTETKHGNYRRYGHPSHHGNLHLYPPDIHPIDNIPPFGEKTMAHVDEVVPRPCMALGKPRQPAAYLWTHLGSTEAAEAPTNGGHIMALISYLPLSQWKAPGTMFHGQVPWRKSTIINRQTWGVNSNGNRMGRVYGMPFTAGYFVGNGGDGPQSIGGTLRKHRWPRCSESPRIMGHTSEALGPR